MTINQDENDWTSSIIDNFVILGKYFSENTWSAKIGKKKI